jgi:hypothetical protein
MESQSSNFHKHTPCSTPDCATYAPGTLELALLSIGLLVQMSSEVD